MSTQFRGFLPFIFLAGALFITTQKSFGQADLKQKVNMIFNMIYDFKLLSADSAILALQPKGDNHPVWPLLKANVEWWKLLSGDPANKELSSSFIAHLNEAKSKAKSYSGNEDEANFTLIIANAFRTRYDLLNGNYVTAAGYLNACVDDISDSFGREEVYEPYYLSSGLYYYFMRKAHEDYPLVRPYLFFFPDGDREKAMSYLKKCTKSKEVFLSQEANYFLMRIALDLDKDLEQTKVYLSALLAAHPDNVIFRKFELDVNRQLKNERGIIDSQNAFVKSVNQNVELSTSQKAYFLSLP